MATKSGERDDQGKPDNRIITPGGPRAKDLVRQVKPGEAVRIDEQGNAVVVSINPSSPRPGETPMDADFILTPGGYRHRSLVHRVEPGYAVRLSPEKAQLLDLATNALLDISKPTMAIGKFPALGCGWIATSYWNNATGRAITSFRTTWQVPAEPATSSNQLIYLFNGITRFSNNSAILQPVLQWGASPDGGGPSWAVASWYVHTTGQAFYTPLVRVNVGDTLVGVMTLTGRSGRTFNYSSEFQGIAGTNLAVQNIDELLWCSETLEAYGVTQCSDYPASRLTAFREIGIQTGNVVPNVTWGVENEVTDCGQRAEVVSSSEVDIYYR
jgi:hypothetical protein